MYRHQRSQHTSSSGSSTQTDPAGIRTRPLESLKAASHAIQHDVQGARALLPTRRRNARRVPSRLASACPHPSSLSLKNWRRKREAARSANALTFAFAECSVKNSALVMPPGSQSKEFSNPVSFSLRPATSSFPTRALLLRLAKA